MRTYLSLSFGSLILSLKMFTSHSFICFSWSPINLSQQRTSPNRYTDMAHNELRESRREDLVDLSKETSSVHEHLGHEFNTLAGGTMSCWIERKDWFKVYWDDFPEELDEAHTSRQQVSREDGKISNVNLLNVIFIRQYEDQTFQWQGAVKDKKEGYGVQLLIR